MLWKTGGFDSLSKSNLFHKFEGRENWRLGGMFRDQGKGKRKWVED